MIGSEILEWMLVIYKYGEADCICKSGIDLRILLSQVFPTTPSIQGSHTIESERISFIL
jgi:hypothetical protein